MAIERSRRRVPAERIRALADALIASSRLLALATASRSGVPHANTAYFARGDGFDLLWLSEPAARHSRNLRANPRAAVAVYESTQTWGGSDRGIQLLGTARPVPRGEEARAATAYAERFPAFRREDLASYRFYRFRPRTMKLFDERVLGGGVFVTATVGADGGVRWERTERYRPG